MPSDRRIARAPLGARFTAMITDLRTLTGRFKADGVTRELGTMGNLIREEGTGAYPGLKYVLNDDGTTLTYDLFPNEDTIYQAADDAVRSRTETHANDETAHGLTTVRSNIAMNAAGLSIAMALSQGAYPVFLNDTFDRANAATLGSSWAAVFAGMPSISANAAASPTQGDGTIYGATLSPGFMQQIVTATIETGLTGEASPFVRFADSSNYILIQLSGGQIAVYSIVAGVYTVIGTYNAPNLLPNYNASAIPVYISAVGSQLSVMINGLVVVTASIPATLTGTMAGFRISGNSHMLDYQLNMPPVSVAPPVDPLSSALSLAPFQNVLTDTFDRADSANLGAVWTGIFAGMLSVKSNAACSPTQGNTTIYGAVMNTGSTNHIITANINSVGSGEASLLARFVDANNQVLLNFSGGILTAYSTIAAANVILGSYNVALMPTVNLAAIPVVVYVVGTVLSVAINGTRVLTVTIPAALSAGTQAGMRIAGVETVLDFKVDSSTPPVVAATDPLQLALLNRILNLHPGTAAAADTFTRADAAALGAAEQGGAWSALVNNPMKIVGNKAYAPTAGNELSGLPQIAGMQNSSVRATINVPAGAANGAGLLVRSNAGSVGQHFTQVQRMGDGTLNVVRYNGAAYVTVASANVVNPLADETLVVVCYGLNMWVVVNDVVALYYANPDSASIYASCGIFIQGVTANVDNFKAYTLGGI